MHTIEFSQFTILPNHAILNSVRSVDCIVKGITEMKIDFYNQEKHYFIIIIFDL